jgi:hypothetical protein
MKELLGCTFKVSRCIESCTTLVQLSNTQRLIENFYKMFGNTYFYNHLKELSQEKLIIIKTETK